MDLRRQGPERLGAHDEIVTAIWRRVLGRGEVGLGDDFFQLGGDPYAASKVLSLLQDAFEVRVPLSEFLEAPTVAGLTSVLESHRTGGGDGPSGPAAVAFSQEGMLWQECFAPGAQNLPGLARRFRGPLDAGILGRTLDEIVRRHGALRTTFALRDGRPVQVVHPHRPLKVPTIDLSGLGPTEREAEVERLVSEAGRRPFDLVAGPLFEPTLLRLGDGDHVLVIRTHHAVFDDWSVGVFRRELSVLYSAYAEGDASPLPELPVQFADFSRRQRRKLAGPAGTRQLEFWRRELAGAPFTTQLPVGDPDLPEGTPQEAGEPVSLALPAELGEGLRALARRERTTLYMAMLAAFGVLVHRSTGQDDLLMATVVANRNRSELEGVIGCFTKKVPLRLDLSGDPTFTEALARGRQALLGALSNQDLPFEAVVQDVLGAPASSHGLVPHVALMFQGVTPRHEVTLPGLESGGFETSSSARRAHFMAAGEDPSAGDLPWGRGLYLGTFLILSLIESPKELSFLARGAFHGPAVSELLESFRALLSDIVADPARRVSDLAILDEQSERPRLRGFGIEPARIRSALVGCPGVGEAAVALHRGERGDDRLVAFVVPDGQPPTPARLRRHLWSRLPGYAWPSSLLVVPRLPAEDGAAAGDAQLGAGVELGSEGSVEEGILGKLWADVLGIDRVMPGQSYWHDFSFLEALARARDAGVPVPAQHVRRNRTIETLAVAWGAAGQKGPGGGSGSSLGWIDAG